MFRVNFHYFYYMIRYLMLCCCVSFLTLSCTREGGRGILCIKPKGASISRTQMMSEFSSVQMLLPAHTTIRQGSEYSIELRGTPNILDNIQAEIRDGELTLSYDRCVRKMEELPELIITAPYFYRLVLSGSGDIQLADSLIQTEGELDLQVLGSGSIQGNLRVKGLRSRISGSGSIATAGVAETHTLTVSGSGDVAAKDFSVHTCEVDISGSGNVSTRVADKLNVKISGSGSVTFWGSPLLTTEITGSGKVIKGDG